MPIEYTNQAADHVAWIIPVRNQEPGIGRLLAAIPPDVFAAVVVSDCGSTDGTAEAAYSGGATVVSLERIDFASGCHQAIAALPETLGAFVCTGSDLTGALDEALQLRVAILDGSADLVIDSRSGEVRAMRLKALRALQTSEPNPSWMVDIPVRARRKGLHVLEMPLGPMSEPQVSWTAAVRLWALGLWER